MVWGANALLWDCLPTSHWRLRCLQCQEVPKWDVSIKSHPTETSTFTGAISAEIPWTNKSTQVYINFPVGGDWMVSFVPQLEQGINAEVGFPSWCTRQETKWSDYHRRCDAGYILNYKGVEKLVCQVSYLLLAIFLTPYRSQTWKLLSHPASLKLSLRTTPWRANLRGLWRIRFPYLRVYGAGYDVPA